MNTPLIDESPAPDHGRRRLSPRPSTSGAGRPRRPRRAWSIAAGVAAATALAIGGAALLIDGGGDGDGGELAAGPPLELSLGAPDPMAMCIAFDVALLAEMPVAFAGTVSSIEGGIATLDVDRWYKGGDAAQVELVAPEANVALDASFELEIGARYLITATDATVNFCGFSGPATPELTAAFDQAFPG